MNGYNNIDEYILSFPEEIAGLLQQIRSVISEAAPGATEKISYGMPTFYLKGNLIYFAAHKTHIGLYPTASPIIAFASRLAAYKTSKGAIQFPYNQPLPLELIREIVEFRIKEKANTKKS